MCQLLLSGRTEEGNRGGSYSVVGSRSKASTTSLLHETCMEIILMKKLEEQPLNYIREGTDKRNVFPVHGMKAYKGE